MADTGGPVAVEQRLYLTRDKTRLVPDGDPDGWTLFCTPGTTIPREQAARYGLLDDPEPEENQGPADGEQQAGAEPEAGPKQRAPRTNKARRPAGDKSADT